MYRQPREFVMVGIIVRAHGIRGEIVVDPMTASADRFLDLERVFIATEDPAGGPPQPRTVEQARMHGGRVLLKVAGIQTRTQAERLAGHEVLIREEERAPTEEGHYYVDDLMGLRVEDSGGLVGEVADVESIPRNPLLCIRLEGGGDVLVPFREAYVEWVDVGLSSMRLADGWRLLLEPVDT